MTPDPDWGIIRRTMSPWTFVQEGSVLQVDLTAGLRGADLEPLIDAIGEFTHGYSSVTEIVFLLPHEEQSDVVSTFLGASAETIRASGVAVRFERSEGSD